jgi:hypothetical protein
MRCLMNSKLTICRPGQMTTHDDPSSPGSDTIMIHINQDAINFSFPIYSTLVANFHQYPSGYWFCMNFGTTPSFRVCARMAEWNRRWFNCSRTADCPCPIAVTVLTDREGEWVMFSSRGAWIQTVSLVLPGPSRTPGDDGPSPGSGDTTRRLVQCCTGLGLNKACISSVEVASSDNRT